MCERAVEKSLSWMQYIPNDLKKREISETAVEKRPLALEFVSDYLKTKKMCEKANEKSLYP